jgi:uncharacterized damage-inducible protein DinB
MSEVDRIADQLEREHSGDPWHGSPLASILEGITGAQAAARPVRGAHSIWEIVLHMTGWKHEVRRRLGGAAAAEPEGGDWPAVDAPSEDEWQRALSGLERAHRDLVAAVKAMPEARLFEATNDPRNRPLGVGVSHYVLLHGIVQHDVYHSGQIAILRKAAES